MNKRTYILFFLLLLANIASAQYCSKIRRVCRSSLNNDLFWNYNSTVPCGTFKEYRIYGRDKTSDPYSLLNTETNENNTGYIHNNANFPSNKNWDYFIETIYTCSSIDQFCYSDTQNVANFGLPKSSIAYVTVDIDSEYPVIVWEKNTYPSFWYVDLFNDNSIKTGIVDTFFIDKTSMGDPKANSLKYVIAAVDSCTKRWDYLPEDYHYTIHLTGNIDTCKNTVSLNWSKYIGWTDTITYYYIYKMLDKTNYKLIDSVSNSTLSYITTINTNQIIDFYVMAVNSKHTNYKSCSNTISFIAGKRNNNQNLKINYITLDKNININTSFNTTADLQSINIFKSTNGVNYQLFKTLTNPSTPANIIDISEVGDKRVFYYLVSKNTCGIYSDTTFVSSNIFLENLQETGINRLWWNKYFTWNNGVEKYVVFRETRLNDQVLNPFSLKTSTSDSNYIDNISNENISIEKLCYKVVGTENITGYTSTSNEVCIIGGLIVYFPDGVISRTNLGVFKPVGVYIDYTKSTLNIYDRWGTLVKEVTDLNTGWDLSDSNNNFVAMETYIYEAKVVGLDDKIINRSGTITVIR